MNKLFFLCLNIMSVTVLGQNKLFDPAQQLYDSLKDTHNTFWIYEISNIAGNISPDTCSSDYYIAYAFTSNGEKIISKTYCFTKLTEGTKEPFDYFLSNKIEILKEEIKTDIIAFHETRKRIIYYSDQFIKEFYVSKSDLSSDNKYYNHNSNLKIISFINSLDELVNSCKGKNAR